MKKSLVILIIIALIFPVSAIETTLKQEYQPGETLIAEISGNFISPLKAEQIQFYSGRLFIPMIYDIAKIEDKYYIYSLLPNKERNYTLIIKNAEYFEAGQEKHQDLSFNFAVKGNLTPFSVNPGFVLASKNFNIRVESKTKTITLTAQFLNSTQEIEIGAGQTKTISFSTAGINKFTKTSLLLTAGDKSYEIPVAVFPEEENIEISRDLRFSKSFLNLTVLEGQEFEFLATLINTGEEDIENISLKITGLENILTLKEEEISLGAGEVEKIILDVKSDEEGKQEGKLLAVSRNKSAEISITLNTIEDEQEFNSIISESEVAEEKSCTELEGKFCKADEQCDGTAKLTIEGLCCVGNCKQEGASWGKIISIIVVILILIIIAFFVFKRLSMKKKTSREILRERTESYEERINPEKIKEERGKLSKV